jgi:16S rRNA (uracil1498-N3)-methyltransferase
MTKIHRFIGRYPLAQGTVRLDDVDLAHQMRSVLKLVPGETVIIGDGTGLEGYCSILEYQRDAVLVRCDSVGHNPNELQLAVTLYCSVLKADHFELAAAKATEIGVRRLVPVVSTNTVKLNLRTDRIERIVREAAELAGRGIIPVVSPVTDLAHAWTEASRNDVNYFFDPSGKAFRNPAKGARTAGIFIGPEGGWDEREREQAVRLGMRLTSLGGLILRAETAVIVASYLVAHGA